MNKFVPVEDQDIFILFFPRCHTFCCVSDGPALFCTVSVCTVYGGGVGGGGGGGGVVAIVFEEGIAPVSHISYRDCFKFNYLHRDQKNPLLFVCKFCSQEEKCVLY